MFHPPIWQPPCLRLVNNLLEKTKSEGTERGGGEGMSEIWATEFEVFGKVQGVFFRKYTAKRAGELGLRGYVMNTSTGSVVGEVQGPQDRVREMKSWLSTVGSPKSKIQRAVWKKEGRIPSYTFADFSIRKV